MNRFAMKFFYPPLLSFATIRSPSTRNNPYSKVFVLDSGPLGWTTARTHTGSTLRFTDGDKSHGSYCRRVVPPVQGRTAHTSSNAPSPQAGCAPSVSIPGGRRCGVHVVGCVVVQFGEPRALMGARVIPPPRGGRDGLAGVRWRSRAGGNLRVHAF